MRYILFGLLLAFGSLPSVAADFPCSLTDFRIVKIDTKGSLYVRCSNIHVTKVDFPGELFEMSGGIQVASQNIRVVSAPFPGWLEVQLEKPLEKKKSYLLRFSGAGIVEVRGQSVPGPFDLVKLQISTKPNARILRRASIKPNELEFILTSNIGMNFSGLSKATLSEEMAGIPRLLQTDFELITSSVAGDPGTLAELRMTIVGDGPRNLDSKLVVHGITNLFGDDLEIDPKKRASIPGAPKSKDDSDLFVKFLNQAGPGNKPGWAADVKFAPSILKTVGGYYITPSILANIGIGTVEDTKVSDSIKAGLGVTKFYRNPGVQFSPRAAFETNRRGTKQNIIFDADSQWFVPNLRRGIKERNLRIYADALLENGDLEPSEVPQQPFGFKIELYAGSEIGAPRTASTVTASEGSQVAVVPTYTIARIRPKISATLEYKRLTLGLSATPRYLFAKEIVTKERRAVDPADATKHIVYVDLHTARGLRAYGEASISYQFDPVGHFALSSTYKLGSEPPNFDYVSTVQTGLVIRF